MKQKEHLESQIDLIKEKVKMNLALMKVVNSKEEHDMLQKEIEDLARQGSLLLYELEYGGKLPNIRVCSLKDVCSTSKQTKCYKCGKVCYFDDEIDIKMVDKCKDG